MLSFGHKLLDYSQSQFLFPHLHLPVLCLILCECLVVPPGSSPLDSPRNFSPSNPAHFSFASSRRSLLKSLHILSVLTRLLLIIFVLEMLEGQKARQERGDGQTEVKSEWDKGKGGERTSKHHRTDEVWIYCCVRSRTSWGAGSLPLHSQVLAVYPADWCMTGPSHYIHSASVFIHAALVKKQECRVLVCVWTGGHECVHLLVWKTDQMTCVLIVSGEQSELSLSDGVYLLWKHMSLPTPAFRMEFGLTACTLERLLGAEGILTLMSQINWADLPSNNEPYKQYKVTWHVGLKQ